MSESLNAILPWLVTYGLILLGLVAAFIPVIPSHLIIIIAAGAHWWMLGEESGLGLTSIIILAVVMISSQTFEVFSGSIGSRWFGGSKWGTIGAILGLTVGIFFPPLGFLLGPLIAALLLELIYGKKNLKGATTSGVGSALGTLTGLLVRMIVALVMIIYLLLDIYLLK